METIESIYANMFREYDDIQAARGCNQYKHVPGCDERGDLKNYEDYRHDIEEVMYKAFSQLNRNGYVDGVFFDGERFHTDNQEGTAVLLYSSADIDDFLQEHDLKDSTVSERTNLFMQDNGMDLFSEIDWDDF